MHAGTAKVLAIGETGVRAYSHAILQRPTDRLTQGLCIACVKTAGNIGRTDQLQQRLVVGTAFAEIGVQINAHLTPRQFVG
ncbi:hypothetical protein D3C75_1197970 [compost metagenome]